VKQAMPEERSGSAMSTRQWGDRVRAVLAEIEEQRDDAVVYLAAIRSVLDIVARGHGTRQCGQAIAAALLHELALETCVVALREGPGAELALSGFATRTPGQNEPTGFGWLALARLVGPDPEPSCFSRMPDGGFRAVAASELSGDGFLVLPFRVADEQGGVLVLHSLVAPAQVFARGRAFALVAEIVGQAFTITGTRENVQRLCGDLEGELGVTRRVLSAQEASLRSHEENIETLTHALIRSNRVKREFLGTVSHELRTPLNAILGYTSLVRDGMAGPLADEQTALLDRVLSNTRNLNTLIDDILFFVQLEADRILVHRQRVGVAALIDDVMGSLTESAHRAEVALRVDIEPRAVTLSVDAALLRRLVFHLLGNAFKFTEQGEVVVSLRPGQERDAALLSVRDTGVGIAPERLSELFELFAQGDSSSTRRHGGLGMGLTIVQRCVRLLRGEMVVESQPGQGSEFRVYLPGVLRAEAEPDAPSENGQSRPIGLVH
jgi:signal transduction histidine kinase